MTVTNAAGIVYNRGRCAKAGRSPDGERSARKCTEHSAAPVFATIAEERLHRKRVLVAAFRLFSRFWIRRSGGRTHHLTRSGQAVAEFINPVYDYARDLASNVSPRSLVVIKRQVYESMFQPLQEGFDASERETLASLDSLDFKEGVAHYLEKRSLAFVGR